LRRQNDWLCSGRPKDFLKRRAESTVAVHEDVSLGIEKAIHAIR
jgi:hypothetical protein